MWWIIFIVFSLPNNIFIYKKKWLQPIGFHINVTERQASYIKNIFITIATFLFLVIIKPDIWILGHNLETNSSEKWIAINKIAEDWNVNTNKINQTSLLFVKKKIITFF